MWHFFMLVSFSRDTSLRCLSPMPVPASSMPPTFATTPWPPSEPSYPVLDVIEEVQHAKLLSDTDVFAS